MSIANLIAERQRADSLIKFVLEESKSLGEHGSKIFWGEMLGAAQAALKQQHVSLFVEACQILDQIDWNNGYELTPEAHDILDRALEKARRALELYGGIVEVLEPFSPGKSGEIEITDGKGPGYRDLPSRIPSIQRHPVELSLEQIENIQQLSLEVIENCHSDRGIEFAEGAASTAKEIGITIEETQVVTHRQQQALDNIMSGLQNWIRD